ncbi:cystathionine gamma-lyase [Henriciella litoralis]|uniref:cystathionine gamma-lyase n=1 Tax=Henriciella litoralis TaxID=568102 RepID=UPI001F1D3AAA|nr:cystathionine gamma-lyase [Henriciella litoralis]
MMALLHGRAGRLSKGESLTPPIVNAAKYALPGSPDHPLPYGRYDNPTWQSVESAIGALEDAETLCFPSGMAAVTAAIMASLTPKSSVLIPSDGYYTVRVLLQEFFHQHEISVTEVPTRQLTDHDVEGFDLVWLETPSNPGLDICDIAAIAQRTHAAGGLVCVDNTTATPLLQRPLGLGADITVSSDTKAIAGHSDVLFGHVSSRNGQIMERVRQWRKLSGSTPGPAEAYLAYRGLMTLELRLSRMCDNAEALANLFYTHKAVKSVRFPGLADDPSYGLCSKQMMRPGFVIGLTFGSASTAESFINDCPAIFAATSFGGIQTSAERRARWGDAVPESYVRLSAGCEPTTALIDTIRATLDSL